MTEYQERVLGLLDRILVLASPVLAEIPPDRLDPDLLTDLQGLSGALHAVLRVYRDARMMDMMMTYEDEDDIPF